MRPVAILGVGTTRFGQFPERTLDDLAREAIWGAVYDSGVDPRPMCASASVDGAAAAIVCSEEVARRHAASWVRIAACSLRGARWFDEEEAKHVPGVLSMDLAPEVFAEAWQVAGVEPKDVDVLQVHDSMAGEELFAYEAMGLCAPGDGARLVAKGRTALGGDLRCNTDGGLLGRGHPIGVAGLAQVCEVTWQLRGQAGNRQVYHRGRPPRAPALQNAGAQASTGGAGVGASIGIVLTR